MSNALKKSIENRNTHLMYSNFIPENRTVYEIVRRNIVEGGRPKKEIQYGAGTLHGG